MGIAYRFPLRGWIKAQLSAFDVLEITVDHFLSCDAAERAAMVDLVGRVPMTAHGIGLSIGTDTPIDLAYLDRVATVLERIKAPAYSEHLAFTRVPGRELGNLLPLPRTKAVAETVIEKIRLIRSRLSVPFLLENIAQVFEWPDTELSDAQFMTFICGESGAGILLDVENLHLNARNHGLDFYGFLDALPPGIVKEVHVAGGLGLNDKLAKRRFYADSHSHPVRAASFDLLEYALERQSPRTVVLERDERFDAVDEILRDVKRIRTRIENRREKITHVEPAPGSAD